MALASPNESLQWPPSSWGVGPDVQTPDVTTPLQTTVEYSPAMLGDLAAHNLPLPEPPKQPPIDGETKKKDEPKGKPVEAPFRKKYETDRETNTNVGPPAATPSWFSPPPGYKYGPGDNAFEAPSNMPAEEVSDPLAAPSEASAFPPGSPSPAPDAISGGALPEQDAAARHAAFQQAMADAGADYRIEGTPQQERQRELAGLPPDQLARQGDASDEQRKGAIDAMSPEQFADYQVEQTHAKLTQELKQRSQANLEDAKKAQDDLHSFQTATLKAGQDSAAVDADAKRLAATQIDNRRYFKQGGVGGMIGNALAAIVGGALGNLTGTRNFAMDQINKNIENDIAAQKDDIANGWRGIDLRRNAIASEYARHGDMYRAEETYRQASYQRAIGDIDTQMQLLDPKGTLFAQQRQMRDAVRAQAQASQLSFAEKQTKIYLDRANAEKALAEAAKLRGQLGGAGGGGTNQSYTVATKIYDPFTGASVMGKQEIGGKGKEKEFETAQAQIATYGHVQDYWDQLRKIGARIGDHKSLAASAWAGFKDTDTADYEAAQHALVVYLTKELGDKLTQGQIDEQAKRIPNLASVLESRDPGELLSRAQEYSDRDFARDMNTIGVDGGAIIANARKMRQPTPQPRTDAAMTAAQKSLADASTPTQKKDALAAVKEAQDREAAAVQRKTDAAAAMADIQSGKLVPVERTAEWGPANVVAGIRSLNSARDTYNRALEDYRKVAAAAPKPTAMKGDDAERLRKHTAEVEDAALAVVGAKNAIDATSKQIAPLFDTSSNDELSKWQRTHPGGAIDTKFHYPGEK